MILLWFDKSLFAKVAVFIFLKTSLHYYLSTAAEQGKTKRGFFTK